MPVTFSPASEIPFDDLVDVFNTGYAGYTVPVQLETDLMRRHIAQNDINLDLSRVAWLDGELVGVGLLAQRDTRGWIGGMGVNSAYRRQGIGRQIMDELLTVAAAHHFTQVQLEVIEGNDAAYNLYESVGFKVTRRLLILQCVRLPTVATSTPVTTTTTEDALRHYHRLHTVSNPWQREPKSLYRQAEIMTAWLAGDADSPDAYVIGRNTGRVLHIADVAFRDGEGALLRALLAYIQRQQTGMTAQLPNLAEDDPAWPVLSTLGYEPSMSQFEMVRVL